MVPFAIIKEEPLDDYPQYGMCFNQSRNSYPVFLSNTLPLPADGYGQVSKYYQHPFQTIATEPGVIGKYNQDKSYMQTNEIGHHQFQTIKTEPEDHEHEQSVNDKFEHEHSPVDFMDWDDTKTVIIDRTNRLSQKHISKPMPHPVNTIKCEIEDPAAYEDFENCYPANFVEIKTEKFEPTENDCVDDDARTVLINNNCLEDDDRTVLINFFYQCPEWDSQRRKENTDKEAKPKSSTTKAKSWKHQLELIPKEMNNSVLQTSKPYLPKRLPCLLNLHEKRNRKEVVKSPPVDLRSYSTIHALKKKVRIGASLASRLEPFKRPNKKRENKLNFYKDTIELDIDDI